MARLKVNHNEPKKVELNKASAGDVFRLDTGDICMLVDAYGQFTVADYLVINLEMGEVYMALKSDELDECDMEVEPIRATLSYEKGEW